MQRDRTAYLPQKSECTIMKCDQTYKIPYMFISKEGMHMCKRVPIKLPILSRPNSKRYSLGCKKEEDRVSQSSLNLMLCSLCMFDKSHLMFDFKFKVSHDGFKIKNKK